MYQNEIQQSYQYILQVSDEKKIQLLYANWNKLESGNLKFSEYAQMMIERAVYTTQYGFKFLFELYFQVLDHIFFEKSQTPDTQVKGEILDMKGLQSNNTAIQEQAVQKITQQQFSLLIITHARMFYSGIKKPVQALLQLLSEEPAQNQKHGPEGTFQLQYRNINFDELNRQCVQQQCIATLLQYEQDLQMIFVLYLGENLAKQHIIIQWQEMLLLNQRIGLVCFLQFLLDSKVVPGVVPVEHIMEMIVRLIPAKNTQQHHFYQNTLDGLIEKEIPKGNFRGTFEGDPEISFLQFSLILLRISLQTGPKEQKQLPSFIVSLFANVLKLRKNEDIKNFQLIKQQQQTPLTEYIIQIYKPPTNLSKQNSKKHNLNEGDVEDQPYKVLDQAQASQRLFENYQPKYEFLDVLKSLFKDLPPLPPVYEVKNTVQDPFEIPSVTIGKKPPPPPPDQSQKPPEKKDPKKQKGEEQKREFPWAGFRQPEPMQSYDHFEEKNNCLELEYEMRQIDNTPSFSHLMPDPIIIHEILYPHHVPDLISKILESAIMKFTQQDFSNSMDLLNRAYEEWLRLEERSQLTLGTELYFEFFRAQIFQSSGREDLALTQYYACQNVGEKLSRDSPDRALGYCGLGSVLFKVEEYEMALRAFNKARTIREESIGGNTVQSANIYNNLACTMQQLNRNLQGQTFFELAHAIFDMELGPYNYRTLVALRNYKYIKKYPVNRTPQFKGLWHVWMEDKFKKVKPPEKQKK